MSTELHSDATIQASWRSRPGDFVSLMTLYESNYVRLGWLLPELQQLRTHYRSLVPGDCGLYLQVEERCRYTTTCTLTYLFDTATGVVTDPNLKVRIYHDAQLAEAMFFTTARHPEKFATVYAGFGQHWRNQPHSWLRNMMLNKWLDYCVTCGHRLQAYDAT